MRLLFVCTANVCRSRAAEEVFRVLTWSLPGRAAHDVRSAGIDPDAGGRQLTEADIRWADLVCVMEASHRDYIVERWPSAAAKLRVLGIPDIYAPGDPVLKNLLTRQVLVVLEEAGSRPVGPGSPA